MTIHYSSLDYNLLLEEVTVEQSPNLFYVLLNEALFFQRCFEDLHPHDPLQIGAYKTIDVFLPWNLREK
jgi:hypothetical protein